MVLGIDGGMVGGVGDFGIVLWFVGFCVVV